MKRHLFIVIGLVASVAAGMNAGCQRRDVGQSTGIRTANKGTRSAGPPAADLDRAIQSASNYLASVCDERGRFLYRVDMERGALDDASYNLLRHAGAVYALALSCERRPDDRVRQALFRSADFLKQQIRPLDDNKRMLALWSLPEVTGGTEPPLAKLGGTGLALIALTQINRIQPEATSLDELQQLAEFIVYMQKSNGDFYSRFFVDRGRDDQMSVAYYPGEAALGLLMLYELDPQARWVLSAARALDYLAIRGTQQTTVFPDQWSLIALARLWPQQEIWKSQVSPDRLLAHARRIASEMMTEQQLDSAATARLGCYTADGQTCPTATRVEGLIAILPLLPPAEREPTLASVRQASEFLVRSQVREGKWAGAVPHAVSPLEHGTPEEIAAFNRQLREVRIDYVQHALNAWIMYERKEVP